MAPGEAGRERALASDHTVERRDARAAERQEGSALGEPRAAYWSRQLLDLNRRRLLVVGAGFALNVLFLFTGAGTTSRTILLGYALWLVQAVVLGEVGRRLRRKRALLAFTTGTLVLDTLFVTVLQYATGGGWWQGAMFFVLIVAIAAAGLPTREGRVVLGAALVGWSVLVLAPAVGWLDPAPWFGLPRVAGNAPLLATLYGLGALAIGAIWRVLRSHTLRTRRAYESNERMIEASPYAMVTLDREARVQAANPAGLRLLGVARDHVLGRGMLRFVPREDRLLVVRAFERALLGDATRVEHRLQMTGEVEHWVSVTYSPLVQPWGEQTIMAIARDITDERRTAVERERMQRELDESRRMRLVGQLVSGVAHELNNPLAAVMSFSEQLLAEAPDAESRAALGIVHEQAGRARAIVRDLLQVVRDRGERARVPTDVAALARASVRAMEPVALARQVTVVCSATDAAPAALLDPTGIGQVFDNLLRNALQAARSPGRVQVRVAFTPTAGWQVQVIDDGAGVPDEVMAHLFEPFYTTRAPGEGTGLGLAVSLGIVEQHGGRIVATNGAPDSGVGASFTVHLPATLATHATAPATPAHDLPDPLSVSPEMSTHSQPDTGGRPPHLLLVDDEPAIRLALERYLLRRGWTVEACGSGLEARDRLLADGAADRIDAIICDLKMPGMTGIELYRLLDREHPEFIDRLVLATGDVASADVAAFLEGVRCPVLEKPFALSALAEVLQGIRSRVTAAATSRG